MSTWEDPPSTRRDPCARTERKARGGEDTQRRESSQAQPISERARSAPSQRDTYEVVIFYDEPTFYAHAGLQPKTYHGVFKVLALDEASAIARAMAEFEHMASWSSVGWPRVVKRVECRKLAPTS